MADIRKCAQTVVDDYCIYKYVTPKSMKKLEQALAEPVEPVCNPHPDAPHGFNRNASHTEDRYVCDCESWKPPSVDALIGVDELANIIRAADGNHSLGAGALAEKIIEAIRARGQK